MPHELVITILLLLAGFYMAWNIGANDVSNAMGTSVGSGALTLFKAVLIAGVLEFCGAFFLGSNVSHTLQKGLVNPDVFAGDPKILLFGMFAALLSTALWLQIASYFGWPVSTTHAIVGAILGFGAVIGGVHAVHWGEVGAIALSWIISPVISAVFSFIIFNILQRKVLFAENPISASKKLIPYLTFVVLFVFSLSVFVKGVGKSHFTLTGLHTLLISAAVGLIAFFISKFFVRKVPKAQTHNVSHHGYSYSKTIKHLQRIKLTSKGDTKDEVSEVLKKVKSLAEESKEQSGFYVKSSDYQKTEKMFASLQILSAAYVAFAHGANDVANAIGPIAAALDIIKHGALSVETYIPTWLLAFGGLGIVIGLATWGWRVMETIGKKITELTPTRGFSAEFGAATTILVASKLGMPISTTHCIVGAVLGVGLARGISALNMRTLRDIAMSWIITIPSSAIVCIVLFYIIKWIF